MKLEETKAIISNECLKYYNLFEEHEIREHEISIVSYSNKWKVYATDERASIITGSEIIFENEDDALNNFIKRLRSLNRIKNKQ